MGETRLTDFKDSTSIAIALLASSTCGISGLPFVYQDASGKQVTVADGGFTDFLPEIDANSVTVKPFCWEGLDLFSLSGKKADVGPTEFVPNTWGVYPPAVEMLDHLYELGYQDMEAWLDKFLEQRLQEVAASTQFHEDKPEVEFHCENDGTVWIDDLLTKVPVDWSEMMSDEKFKAAKKEGLKPVLEGWLVLAEVSFYGMDSDGKPVLKQTAPGNVRRFTALSKVDIRWSESQDAMLADDGSPAGDVDYETLDDLMRGLARQNCTRFDATTQEGPAPSLERSKQGRLHVSWIVSVALEAEGSCCVLLKTNNFCVTLKADSPAEAAAWRDAVNEVLAQMRSSVLTDGDHYGPGLADAATGRVAGTSTE